MTSLKFLPKYSQTALLHAAHFLRVVNTCILQILVVSVLITTLSLSSSSIRVWDYTQDACIMVLNGHTAPVRGLLWSTEIPYLLISGSWDYSIRIWDTRDGACIDTVLDHGADVYGGCYSGQGLVDAVRAMRLQRQFCQNRLSQTFGYFPLRPETQMPQ